ncbi:MAG: cytochrome P450 [Vulcanimicrobiota bacterium]
MLVGPRLFSYSHRPPVLTAGFPSSIPDSVQLGTDLPNATLLAQELEQAKESCPNGIAASPEKRGLQKADTALAQQAGLVASGPAANAVAAQQSEFRRGVCPYLATMGKVEQGVLEPEAVGKLEFASSLIRNHGNAAVLFEEMHTAHGSTFQVQGASGPILFDTRPETVEQLLVRTEDPRNPPLFQKSAVASHGMAGLFGTDNVFLNDGPGWKLSRQAVMPYFSSKHVHTDERVAAIDAIVGRHLDRLGERVGPGAVVDLQEVMEKTTLDVALNHIFSADLTPARLDEIHAAFAVAMQASAKETMLPGSSSRADESARARVKQAYSTLESFADELIAGRRSQGVGQRDALDGLLSMRHPDTGLGPSDSQLRHEILTLMLAGHETTASLLGWTLCELARNPEGQAQARAEIEREIGSAEPGFRSLKGLQGVHDAWFQSAVDHTPSFLIARQAVNDTLVGPEGAQVEVKKGTTILASIRHANQTRSASGSTKVFSFGGGPRMCIGQMLARLEAELVMTRFLQRFEVSAQGPLQTASGLSAHPHDARVEVKPR